jgi:hypothetical protein
MNRKLRLYIGNYSPSDSLILVLKLHEISIWRRVVLIALLLQHGVYPNLEWVLFLQFVTWQITHCIFPPILVVLRRSLNIHYTFLHLVTYGDILRDFPSLIPILSLLSKIIMMLIKVVLGPISLALWHDLMIILSLGLHSITLLISRCRWVNICKSSQLLDWMSVIT